MFVKLAWIELLYSKGVLANYSEANLVEQVLMMTAVSYQKGPLVHCPLKYQAHKCFQTLIKNHYNQNICWTKNRNFRKDIILLRC